MNKSNYWLIPFFVCGLFYYPLIANNLMYMDDTFRAISGYDGWASLGRPFADFVMHRVMLKSAYLIGYAQLGQLISVAIMALTSIFISNNVFTIDGWFKYVLCCGFALNPFFLENMSYQYDSLPMAISLCLPVVAAIIIWRKGLYNILIAVALLIIATGLYQTSVNTYVGFFAATVLIKTASNQHSPKDIIISCVKGISAILLSTIAYMMIIKLFIPMTSDRGSLVDMGPGYIDYFLKLSNRAYGLLANTLSYRFSVISLIFIALVSVFGIMKGSNKTLRTILVLIAAFVVYFSMVGIVSLIRDQFVASRILMGASAITFLFFALAGLQFVPKWASISASVIIILPLFLASYSYGFASKYQREYDSVNVNSAINDIRRDQSYDQKSYISFSGRMPFSPVVSHTIKKYDLIALIVMPSYDWTASMMAQSWGVSGVRFNFSRGEQKETIALVCGKNAPKISENDSYAIYRNVNKNGYLVWMKGVKKNPC